MLPTSETLALRTTLLGSLDPRVKFILTLAYSLAVVAVPFERPLLLIPLALPLALAAGAGDVPARYFLRRLLAGMPFVLFVILFPLLLQRDPAVLDVAGAPVPLTEGAVRSLSVAGKFVLAFGAAVVLTATTGFARICEAMARLRFPPLFVSSVSLVWRYLFVLVDEAARMLRARRARSVRRATWVQSWRSSAAIVGSLFLRALARSERVHVAMEARGFRGTLPVSRAGRFSGADWTVLAGGLLSLAAFAAIFLVRRP